VALVLGTVVRLLVGFGGAVVVFFAAGDTFRAEPISFWAWVLGTYLVTLVVEMVLLSRSGGDQKSGVRG
jgi:predicted benzoate:H+ symporter BenE